jgi:drug/metabolite transporter (DMT)-like permease
VIVATGSLYLIPPLSVLIGYLWLDELPTPAQLIGGAIAIAGVALANGLRRPSGRSVDTAGQELPSTTR